jgi:hypothetical protein
MGVKMLVRSLAVMAMVFGQHGNGLATTDTITWGGDNSRSGYFPYVPHRIPGSDVVLWFHVVSRLDDFV